MDGLTLRRCHATGSVSAGELLFEVAGGATQSATPGVGTATGVGTSSASAAVAQTLSTPKNKALQFSVFDLMRNDYDPDNDPLSIVEVRTEAGAIATVGRGWTSRRPWATDPRRG